MMNILAGFLMLEFFIESSVILLPGASPKLSGSFDVAVLEDTGLTLAWRCNWRSPALEPLFWFCSLRTGGCGQALLQSVGIALYYMREEKKGRNSVGEGGGGELELPFAWCHIARVRTCVKSGWAQSCRHLALLCLFPKYVVEKESSIRWELYVLRMFRNLLAQLKGPGEKRKRIHPNLSALL